MRKAFFAKEPFARGSKNRTNEKAITKMSTPPKLTDLPQDALVHIFSFIAHPDPKLGTVCRVFDELLGRISCQYVPLSTPPTLKIIVYKQPTNLKLTDFKIRRHLDRVLLSQIRKNPGKVSAKKITVQYAKIGEHELAYQMVQEIDDIDAKIEALSKLAKIEAKQGNITKALRFLGQSIGLAKNICGQKKTIILNQIAFTEHKLGLDFVSKKTFMQAITDACDPSLKPAQKVSNLCEILLSMGQLAQTDDTKNLTNQILEIATSQTNISLCVNLVYQPLLQVLNKLRMHKTARKIIDQDIDRGFYSRIENEIGAVAAVYAREKLSKEANDLYNLIDSAAIRSYYQAEGGLFEEAEESLYEALGNFSEGYTCIDLLDISKAELKLGKVEKGLGRLRRAKAMSNHSPFIFNNACRLEASMGLLDHARITAGENPVLLLAVIKNARTISEISSLYDIVETKDNPYVAILNAETFGILHVGNMSLFD